MSDHQERDKALAEYDAALDHVLAVAAIGVSGETLSAALLRLATASGKLASLLRSPTPTLPQDEGSKERIVALAKEYAKARYETLGHEEDAALARLRDALSPTPTIRELDPEKVARVMAKEWWDRSELKPGFDEAPTASQQRIIADFLPGSIAVCSTFGGAPAVPSPPHNG